MVWLAILVALAESARTADGMDGTVCGCAFIAMLGLMTAMTLLSWFPLGVLPAALAGALMAFLLWKEPRNKLHGLSTSAASLLISLFWMIAQRVSSSSIICKARLRRSGGLTIESHRMLETCSINSKQERGAMKSATK